MTQSDPTLENDNARVCEALRFASIHVDSVYDLVNTSARYDAAIPILAAMLNEVRHPRILEGIARALTVKEARDATPELIRAFRQMKTKTPQEESAKWAIGNAIAKTARELDMPEIMMLVRDKSHGDARMMLPAALARTKQYTAAAIETLLLALEDEILIPQAATALAKMRVKAGVEPLRQLLTHPNKEIQAIAKKTLAKMSP